MHTPAAQASFVVHALPSSHADPSTRCGFEQFPVAGEQFPGTWQPSLAVQITGLPPVQTPAWQASTCVHPSPSLQDVPSGAAGSEHTPVAGAHVPTPWHASLAVHTTAFAPTQAPIWHVSVCVQASPSLQADPSAFAGFEHEPSAGLQIP